MRLYRLMENNTQEKKVCPRCRHEYDGFPALSRSDNKTEVCSDCGQWEAMYQFAHKGALPKIEDGFGVCTGCGYPLDSAGMCTAPISNAD